MSGRELVRCDIGELGAARAMKEPTDRNHRSKLKEELVKRGFALELDAYLALNRRGWISGMQVPFTDAPQMRTDRTLVESMRDQWNAPSEPTYRTIDIASIYSIPTHHPQVSSAYLELAIECKWRSDEDWVFYTESIMDTPRFRFAVDQLSKLGVPNLEGVFRMVSYGETSALGDILHGGPAESLTSEIAWNLRAASHQIVARAGRYAVSHVTVFKKKDAIDNITGACLQALGATSYFAGTNPHVAGQTLTERKPFMYWRLYPVVVFSGGLWETKLGADGELDVEPLRWVTYLHTYKGRPHSVDVVSSSHLEEYLDVLGSEVDSLQKLLSATGSP